VEDACELMLGMRKIINDWEKSRGDKLRSMSR